MNKVCFCEIKPSLANCGDGSWKNELHLIDLLVFSQMLAYFFLLLQSVNTHVILLIN